MVSKFVFHFYYLIIIYIYLYSPPFKFVPVNLVSFFVVLVMFFFVTNEKFIRKLFSYYRVELAILFLIASYILFLIVIGHEFYFGFVLSVSGFFVLLASFFLVFLIGNECQSNKYIFFKFLVVAASIASFTAIAMLINQDLTYYVRNDILKFDFDINRYQLHRGFGLSNELLFSFTIVQSICIIILLEYRLYNWMLTLVLIVVLLASILVNARIGLAPVLIYFSLKLGQLFLKQDLRFYLIVILVLFFSFFLDYFFRGGSSVDSLIFYQFISFFAELLSIFGMGSDSLSEGQLGALFGRMFYFPDTALSFLFGTGVNVFYLEGESSDVGWVILLNYGGFFLCLAIFIWILMLSFYNHSPESLLFRLTIFLSFFIVMFKGLLWSVKPGLAVLVIVLVALRYFERRHKGIKS